MAANTGRTVSHYCDFRIDDSIGTLRSIPIDSINGVGVECEEVDLTAFMDKIRGAIPNMPTCKISITGPFDTSPVAAAGTYSGSHTVLSEIVGRQVPLSLDVLFGMRQTYVTGEPTFGITSTTTSGFLCSKYVYDGAGKYSAEFIVYAGSTAPEWALAAHS